MYVQKFRLLGYKYYNENKMVPERDASQQNHVLEVTTKCEIQ
jgi:hypothetical protein